MKRIPFYLVVISLFIASTAKSQTDQFSMSELSPYINSYMQPFEKAYATSLNGGWTTTAAVHRFLGFDVTLSGMMVTVPSGELTFDPTGILGDDYTITGTNNAPTIGANNNVVPPSISRDIFSTGGQSLPLAFDGPKGLGQNRAGMFALQGCVGLPKGTEVMFRLIPVSNTLLSKVNVSGVDIGFKKTNMWGIGVKHNIKQWIPVVEKIPFLQISGMFNYSKLKTGIHGDDFRFDPAFFSEYGMGVVDNEAPGTWDNQSLDIEMSSISGSLLVGASFPVFQPFLGLGYNSAKFEAGMKGNYPIIEYGINSSGQPILETAGSETNPIKLDSKVGNMYFQAGCRLKLTFFILHYSYTMQEYNMHSAGLGFTVGRKHKGD